MRFPSIFIIPLSLFILSPSNLYYSPRIQISIDRQTMYIIRDYLAKVPIR